MNLTFNDEEKDALLINTLILITYALHIQKKNIEVSGTFISFVQLFSDKKNYTFLRRQSSDSSELRGISLVNGYFELA